MAIQVTNTSSQLSGKTIVTTEADETVTGLKTFSRTTNPPFAVNAGAASVANLDADKLDGAELSDLVKKDGTVAMTGTLDLGSVGKVQFPAVQSASAGANVLDDYEEGSWTPVIGGDGGTSGQAYTSQVGRYIKIGKLVWANFSVTLSTEGTITGNCQVQGLPFTADNVAGLNPINCVQWSSLATTWVNVICVVLANTTTANVRGTTAAATANTTALTAADINNTSSLVGTILYQASA